MSKARTLTTRGKYNDYTPEEKAQISKYTALDRAMQDYVTSMRTVGGVVNTTIVMAAAEGIIAAIEYSFL